MICHKTKPNPLLPLLSGPLWLSVVVPVRVPSMGQIELFNHLLYLKPFKCVQTLLILNSVNNTWNDYVQTNELWFVGKYYLQTIHSWILSKQDLALNNPQGPKTQSTKWICLVFNFSNIFFSIFRFQFGYVQFDDILLHNHINLFFPPRIKTSECRTTSCCSKNPFSWWQYWSNTHQQLQSYCGSVLIFFFFIYASFFINNSILNRNQKKKNYKKPKCIWYQIYIFIKLNLIIFLIYIFIRFFFIKFSFVIYIKYIKFSRYFSESPF